LKQSRLHFIGIGGQGISALAQMARQSGEIVTGCDQHMSATVKALQQSGIPVQIGHSAEHVRDIDMLVISPAVPALDPENVELGAAKERDIPIVTWQELLGQHMRDKCVLSVSGVHGKGTTTAMLSLALIDAGFDPTCEIGAVVPRFGANYRLGSSQYFVNEADEFNHNFWHYHPRLVIVTSIEFEHPEFFADYTAFLDAFEHFIRGMDMRPLWSLPPTLIINRNSPGCQDLCERLQGWNGQVITYGVVHEQIHAVTKTVQVPSYLSYQASFEAFDVRVEGETSFRVSLNNQIDPLKGDKIHLRIPGVHNIENALAAFAAAYTLGADASTIVRALEGFEGNRRRFEIRHQGSLPLAEGEADVILVDDYAHHPTAIKATLAAAHQRYPQRRLVAVYQPHMFSRTRSFFEQFSRAFDAADVAIIADIFPARERDTGTIHARDLVVALALRPHFGPYGGAQVMYGGSIENTVALLNRTLQSGDLVVIMGAGDIYTVTERLLARLEEHR